MVTQPRNKAENSGKAIRKKLEFVQYDDKQGVINSGLL